MSSDPGGQAVDFAYLEGFCAGDAGVLAERQGYRDAAARITPDRNTVRDEARIEDVVAKVKAAAHDAGLSVKIAEPVWRTLIERCIAYEFEVWDAIRAEA